MSILGGEICAFTDAFYAFDASVMLKYDLKLAYRRNVTIEMFTDSKGLFDIITKSSGIIEK